MPLSSAPVSMPVFARPVSSGQSRRHEPQFGSAIGDMPGAAVQFQLQREINLEFKPLLLRALHVPEAERLIGALEGAVTVQDHRPFWKVAAQFLRLQDSPEKTQRIQLQKKIDALLLQQGIHGVTVVMENYRPVLLVSISDQAPPQVETRLPRKFRGFEVRPERFPLQPENV